MKTPPDKEQLERFGVLLAGLIGLRQDESKFNELAKVLQNRMQANSLECTAYLNRLASAPGREEIGQLAQELTVTETYFMRNIEQIDALLNTVLPERAKTTSAMRPLKILSAACASGEEPYSLAIALRASLPHLADMVAIKAVDFNPAMLQKAAIARYGDWSLRVCPAESKSRWFTRDGGAWQLDKTIREAVSFETLNLAQAAPEFWHEARFDVIFCRNVLMYFSVEQARAAIARMSLALAPDGYLFLGHAETLRGLSGDFHLRHTDGAFYYQRKGTPGSVEQYVEATTAASIPSARPMPDANWFHEIQRASARINSLTAGENTTPGATASAQAAEPPPDPDSLLLRAISASHNGNTDEAEATCHALLQSDELSAGAHYILALCNEGRGNVEAALEHDRIAAYLDANFAMPRLHIGLLTRRLGERGNARRELNAALNLIQLEDPARLMLFGGGFKREALMALCRAELSALGAEA